MGYSIDVTVLLQDFYTVGSDVFAFAMHRPRTLLVFLMFTGSYRTYAKCETW